jgi:uncharacterized protein (DUF1499 family)
VLGQVALVLAALGALAVLSAGPGTRLGLWDFRIGFQAMRYGVYTALAGAGLGLVGLILGGARAWAAGAIVVGLVTFAGPWWLMRSARAVPPIHDISTDTADPPGFVDVLARRKDAPNPPAYAGGEVANQQRRAYPDLQPLRLPLPPAQAFERALQAARDMGWELVGSDAGQGRIEATDTTTWFGFKDDVVIRVRGEEGGSRVDVRSKSRVGRSDVGANAKRIRRYLERLRAGS